LYSKHTPINGAEFIKNIELLLIREKQELGIINCVVSGLPVNQEEEMMEGHYVVFSVGSAERSLPGTKAPESYQVLPGKEIYAIWPSFESLAKYNPSSEGKYTRSKDRRDVARLRGRHCVIRGPDLAAPHIPRSVIFSSLHVAHIFPAAAFEDKDWLRLYCRVNDNHSRNLEWEEVDSSQNMITMSADLHGLYDDYGFSIYATGGEQRQSLKICIFEKGMANPILGKNPLTVTFGTKRDVQPIFNKYRYNAAWETPLSKYFKVQYAASCIYNMQGNGPPRGNPAYFSSKLDGEKSQKAVLRN
ncbi:hypothetical protein H0H87_005076, partial [Tephrocybe sp. NHM501043]